MPFRINPLEAPVACKSPFHEGQPLAAQRFVSLQCPECHEHWDPLLCSVCYGRIGKRVLVCKCGGKAPGVKWIAFDVPIKGPMTAKA